MGFLERLQSDLKHAVLEHQHALVVQLLQRRFAELTLDDLRMLLASPLGRGLGSVLVADLVPAPSTPGVKDPSTTAKPRSTAAKTPMAKTKATTPKTRRNRKRNAGPGMQAAVLAALQAESAPISGPGLATTMKRHRTSVSRALRELVVAGKVVTSGNPKRLRYAATRVRTGGTAGASGEAAKRKPTGSTSQSTTTTGTPQPRVAEPSFASQADYDAAVLSTIRGANERMASSAIQAKVGGSIDQVRAALQRLVAAGQVVRLGERKFTRYGVAG